jgi:hypothetical protein
MCKGRGVPGSSTTSSGNKGRRATKSPDREGAKMRESRLYDIIVFGFPWWTFVPLVVKVLKIEPPRRQRLS